MTTIWAFLQQTCAATAVALFLLLLQRIFLDKLCPRWQYGVWAVLLARLVLPVGIAGRTSALDVWPWIEQLRIGAELQLSSAYASPWHQSLPALPFPLPPQSAPASITDWLFILYTAGVVLSVLWFLLCALRLHRRVNRGVPVAGERLEAVQRVAEQYGLPMPARVMECKWEHGPFLMGALRPTLVLPMGWTWDEHVILHELLHLKYKDIWAGWLTTLLRCIHWCNPVLWLVFDKIGNDREALCDQRVLERLEGEARRDYGRVLLAMADDRAVRTPGATTMANGSRAIKSRIASIVRFKHYPQGMTLVSVCITLVLTLALVVGFPALAASSSVQMTHTATQMQRPTTVTAALSAAQLHRPTTVAGTLDAYGKHLLAQQDIYTALMCAAMVTPADEMPALMEKWEAYRRTDSPYPWPWASSSQEIWVAGPLFRGLVSDGDGGYLCQVFWFRDAEIAADAQPQNDHEWPIEYLCHTVWLRPDKNSWTVTLLDEYTGSGMPLLTSVADTIKNLYGPVTWSGSAGEYSLELSPTQLLETCEGMLGLDSLTAFSGTTVPSFSFTDPAEQQAQQDAAYLPQRNAPFYSIWRGTRYSLTNTSEQYIQLPLDVTPLWQTPKGLTEKESSKTHAAQPIFETIQLEGGASVTENDCHGGVSGSIEQTLSHYVGPDGYEAALHTPTDETLSIPLTSRYTTPDGHTLTLPGKEDAP